MSKMTVFFYTFSLVGFAACTAPVKPLVTESLNLSKVAHQQWPLGRRRSNWEAEAALRHQRRGSTRGQVGARRVSNVASRTSKWVGQGRPVHRRWAASCSKFHTNFGRRLQARSRPVWVVKIFPNCSPSAGSTWPRDGRAPLVCCRGHETYPSSSAREATRAAHAFQATAPRLAHPKTLHVGHDHRGDRAACDEPRRARCR